ncbi:hypothetical protein [Algoriphagus marincola]|uniref:hypothetical protein n=1 Tax=Algoriphagus marincola TaxID=264027 RepID=UPI00047E32A3|nr:hypothetical protein [Algoriphagus marincola]
MTELRWAMGIGTAAVLILGLMVFWYVYRLKGSGKSIIYLAVSIMWLAWGSYVAVVFMLIQRHSKVEPTPEVITEIGMTDWNESELQAGLFGWGKPKYNQNRIQRQNSPKRKNRRAKRIQRRYGLAMEDWKEVNRG